MSYNCIKNGRFKPTSIFEGRNIVFKTREELYCFGCLAGPYRGENCFFARKLEDEPKRKRESSGPYMSDEFILQVIENLEKLLGRPAIFSDMVSSEVGVCYDTVRIRFGGLPTARALIKARKMDGSWPS